MNERRHDCLSTADMQALDEVAPDRAAQARTMLEAHRELMALNEKNRETFKDVVDMIARELGDGLEGGPS